MYLKFLNSVTQICNMYLNTFSLLFLSIHEYVMSSMTYFNVLILFAKINYIRKALQCCYMGYWFKYLRHTCVREKNNTSTREILQTKIFKAV